MLNKSVKPVILACFGDVAFAIEENFAPYLPGVMSVLGEAAQIQVDQVCVA